MIDIEKPKIEIVEISEDNRYGKFVCEPLERGYGTTFGIDLAVECGVPFLGVVQCLGSCQLEGTEHTAIHVALHF